MPSSRARPQLLLPILLIAAASLLVWQARPALSSNVEITARGGILSCEAGSFAYTPVQVNVAPGSSVTFNNPSSHEGTGCTPEDHPTSCRPETRRGKTAGDCPFQSFELSPGGSHNQQFPAEGTYQLICIRHPYMEMTVRVGDGVPDDPDPTETDEPDPDPTEPDEPDPNPTELDEPSPTDSPSATASPSSEPTTAPTAGDTTTPEPAPSVTADPIAQPEVVIGGGDGSRGPLLIVATTLLGFAVGGLLWTRELFAR